MPPCFHQINPVQEMRPFLLRRRLHGRIMVVTIVDIFMGIALLYTSRRGERIVERSLAVDPKGLL